MREILFRGKRLDNGEWVEGSYIPEINGCHATILLGAQNGFGIYVDPATVGQFTGLLDKNGKRIFEGDIIRDRFSKRPAVVRFYTEDVGSCGCCYPSFVGSGFKADGRDMSQCEVIGNIHDTSGFLEEVQNERTM